MTLERIVCELTKSVASKLHTSSHHPSWRANANVPPEKAIMVTVKGDRYGADIKEAIKTLETRVEDFMSQAEVCGAQQLGRLEEGVNDINNFLKRIMKDEEILREAKRALDEEKAIEDRVHDRTLQELQQKVKQQELQIAVYNKCYGFLTANPAVDSRTGKGESFLENPGKWHANLELTWT